MKRAILIGLSLLLVGSAAYVSRANRVDTPGETARARIGSDSIVCDWQTVGKNHIHLTLRGRLKGGA